MGKNEKKYNINGEKIFYLWLIFFTIYVTVIYYTNNTWPDDWWSWIL